MAWKDNLLPASFRGVGFEVLDIEDELRRSVAEHERAYVEGTDTEDLGGKGRQVRVQAIFWGDDYETRLQAFLKALETPGDGELIHPVFGSRRVQLRSSRIYHTADRPDSATLSLDFIESRAGQAIFNTTLAAAKPNTATNGAETSWLAAVNSFRFALPSLKSLLPGAAEALALAEAIDSKVVQIRNITSGYITSGLGAVNYPTAWMGDIRGLFQAIADPFRTSALVNQSSSSGPAATATVPARLAAWSAGTEAAAEGVAAGATSTASFTTLRLSAKGALAEADALANAQVRLAATLSRVELAAAIFSAEIDDTPTLDPNQVEQIANEARAALQASIDDMRTVYDSEHAWAVTEPLKTTALAVQDAGKAVLVLRPPVMVRAAPVTGNLALVAFALYGDYTRWHELARLNPDIVLPNFIRAGQPLSAYAS